MPSPTDTPNNLSTATPAANPHVEALEQAYGPLEHSVYRGQQRVIVPAESSFDVLAMLKTRGFDLLVDVSCVDYLEYRGATNRYGLIYLLASTATNERLTVRAFVNDPEPTVASAVPLWKAANWLEREVWDMFGIRFTGHPDHRRLVMPEAFAAHPLRKDYPLQGRGERHNFPVITRDHS